MTRVTKLRIWRSVRTVFFLGWPYRLLNFIRNWSYDLVALAPLVAVLVAWSLSPLGLPPPALEASDDSLDEFLIQHDLVRLSPFIIAALLAVVTLRIDRRSRAPKQLRHSAAVVTRPAVGGFLFLGLLAGTDLWFLPGSIVNRFGPSLIALAWGVFLRRKLYHRVGLWIPTNAGFRPPLRSLWRRRTRRAVRDFQILLSGQRSAKARQRFDTAIGLCATDVALRAWCVARAIEFDLSANALAEAEHRVRLAEQDQAIRSWPAVLGAKGQFYLAVGRVEQARRAFTASAIARKPYRLRTLLYESGAFDSAVQGRRWTGLRRCALVWNRQFYVVIQDLLARLEQLRRSEFDQDLALPLATRIVALVIELGKPSAYADLSLTEARGLQLARAAAEETAAEMLATRCRYEAATRMFTSAMNIYRVQGHRPRSGAAGVSAAVTAFQLPIDGPEHEAKLLDLLLHSLQAIELDRGRLRAASNRLELIRARDQRRLYHDALDVLCTKVRYYPERAAELALWLLESMHRSTLGDAIRQGAYTFEDTELIEKLNQHDDEEATCRSVDPNMDDDGCPVWTPSQRLRRLRAELRDRLPDAFGDAVVGDPVDLEELHRLLDGRVALYFDCREHEDGWQITTVLTSHLGTHLHQTTITDLDTDAAERNATRSAAGLLRALSSTDATTIRDVHVSSILDDRNWVELADSILPPHLDETLRQASAPGFPAVLCVVPDGPLCMVPFGALRLDGDRMIVDEASVTFLPSLSVLTQTASQIKTSDLPVVVTHLGPTAFAAEFEMARPTWPRVLERRTETKSELMHELDVIPAPDLAVISHHGADSTSPYDQFVALRDGGVLSATTAMRRRWPHTVVLGSCWAGRIMLTVDSEPFGLPTACMLGGATTVLGGQAPVDNDSTSAALLAEIVLRTATGEHASAALRTVVLNYLATDPFARCDPPAQWATLMAWSTDPPDADGGHAPRRLWTSHAKHGPGTDTATTQGSVDIGHLVPAAHPRLVLARLEPSTSLVRALRHARARTANHHAVSTLDALAAIIATDSADWTSFLVALGAGEPPWSIRETTGPYVDIVLPDTGSIVASKAVGAALRKAEALARHLDDPTTTPAHLVYGMMTCGEDVLAVKWLRSFAEPDTDIVGVLSDRVFGIDLPAPENVVVGRAPTVPSVRRAGRGRPPLVDAVVRETALRACSGRVLAATDFLSTIAATDPTTWERLGSPAVPTEESPHGGVAVDLGNGVEITATHAFANAIDVGRRIAFYLGDPAVTPLHIAYAALAVSPNGPDAQSVFGRPLPASERLAPSPTRFTTPMLALLPLVLIYELFRWAGKKGINIGFPIAFLLLIAATVSVHDVYDAPDVATAMWADLPAITASVDESGTDVPAVLLGQLSDFYVQPQVTGASNLALEALQPNTPPAIRDWYAFVLPASYHGRQIGSSKMVTINYRGRRYPAIVSCHGNMAKLACLATVHLLGAVAPSGITWQQEQLNGSANDAVLPNRALVLATSGRTVVVDSALLLGLASNASGKPLSLAAQDATRTNTLLAVTPVVLAGKSGKLPLLGIAFGNPRVAWPIVVDSGAFAEFAEFVANRQAGSVSGAQGFLGIEMTSIDGKVRVASVLLGAAADDADIEPDDVIESVDGVPVHSSAAVIDTVRAHAPGDVVKLGIIHDGRNRTALVTLDYLPLGG